MNDNTPDVKLLAEKLLKNAREFEQTMLYELFPAFASNSDVNNISRDEDGNVILRGDKDRVAFASKTLAALGIKPLDETSETQMTFAVSDLASVISKVMEVHGTPLLPEMKTEKLQMLFGEPASGIAMRTHTQQVLGRVGPPGFVDKMFPGPG